MTRSPTAAVHVNKGRLAVQPPAGAPAVILVEPQLAENLGTTARAMRNAAWSDLRLVDPKVDWLSEKALAAASGGERVLEAARRFDTVEAALADLTYVYAATARRREMIKPLFTAKGAAADMPVQFAAGRRLGVLFGRERHGLTNDEVAFAQWRPEYLLRIPRAQILQVDTTRTHLERTMKNDVLRIRWTDATTGAEDTFAAFVRDLDPWLTDLGGQRSPHDAD